MINKMIIGAPFGNYLNWPGFTSTLGTFTLENRGGWWYRLWRMMRTVRYYPGIKAWKNQLGLPNPGIDWLINNQKAITFNKIISICAWNTQDWHVLLRKVDALSPLAIEMNISCPNKNCLDTSNYIQVFEYAAEHIKTKAIVKLPPVQYHSLVDEAINAGLRNFHCCNTIPVEGVGGISGKPLKPLSLDCVRYVSVSLLLLNEDKKGILIGGGGISNEDDVKDYTAVGATNCAIASACFNVFRWRKLKCLGQN